MRKRNTHKLKERLEQLKEEGGLVALKTGTEVEDMSFEEIAILRELSRDLLPLFVKTGGPEARNDIRNLAALEVDGLIAPMIESPYALKKFIETLREVLSPSQYRRIKKGINLETIQGFHNMNSIFALAEIHEISRITAARTDLSGSMDLPPDHTSVLEICSVIVARSRELEMETSVGGAIHAAIVPALLEQINPHTINTRHMVLESRALKERGTDLVNRNLEFEQELYAYLSSLPGPRQKAHGERARIIGERLRVGKKEPVRS